MAGFIDQLRADQAFVGGGQPGTIDQEQLMLALRGRGAPTNTSVDFKSERMPNAKDVYGAVLGGRVDGSNMQDIADQLRHQATRGMILSGSGDKPLMGMGKQLSSSAESLGERAGAVGSADRGRDLNEKYYGWQQDSANLNRQADHDNSILKLATASTKAGNKLAKATQGFASEVMLGSTVLGGVVGLEKSYKPEYSQAIGQLFGARGYLGPIEKLGEDWFATKLPAVLKRIADPVERKRMQDAALWWNEVDRSVRTPLRNQLYGATLTSSEKGAFESFLMLAQGMDPQLVYRSLANMKRVARDKERRRVQTGVSLLNLSPEQVSVSYRTDQGSLLDDYPQAPPLSGSPASEDDNAVVQGGGQVIRSAKPGPDGRLAPGQYSAPGKQGPIQYTLEAAPQ